MSCLYVGGFQKWSIDGRWNNLMSRCNDDQKDLHFILILKSEITSWMFDSHWYFIFGNYYSGLSTLLLGTALFQSSNCSSAKERIYSQLIATVNSVLMISWRLNDSKHDWCCSKHNGWTAAWIVLSSVDANLL